MKLASLFLLPAVALSALTLDVGDVWSLTSDVYDSNLNVTLDGGSILLNGFSLTIRDLRITAPSILDFAGDAELIIRRRIEADSCLSVLNFTEVNDYFYSRRFKDGEMNVSGAPMDKIIFADFSGADTRWTSDRRLVPVPEPSYAFSLSMLLSLFLFKRKPRC